MKFPMKLWPKLLGLALLSILLLMLLVSLLAPFLVDANAFRPRIERELTQALNRPVSVGNLSLSLVTSSLVADNVIISDDPHFSSSPFLQASALHIGVQPWPLLFHQRVVVTRLSLDRPVIHLIHTTNGIWNFSSLSQQLANVQPAAYITAPARILTTSVAVARFAIHHGTVSVDSQPRAGQSVVYQDVDLSARELSTHGNLPFELSASLPAGSTVRVTGRLGMIDLADASHTPFQATIAVKNFDPGVIGIIEKDRGLSLVADINAQTSSDGRTLRTHGDMRTHHLQLLKNGEPCAQPFDVAYDLVSNLAAHSGQVRELQINTRDTQGALVRVVSHASGSYTFDPVLRVDLQISMQQLPVDSLQTLLPAVGVKLPRGSRLSGGTVGADLKMSGVASAPQFSGPVEVANTTLIGFNLGSKLEGLSAISRMMTGDATSIQSLRTIVTTGPDGAHIDNLYAAIDRFGTATGNGVIYPGGALDFDLLVKLNLQSSTSGFGILSDLGGLLGRTVSAAMMNGIPLKVTGTQQEPRFRLGLPQIGSTAQPGGPINLASSKEPGTHPRQLLQRLLDSRNH